MQTATSADFGAVTEIYNHYVRTSTATFDTEPFTPEARRPWFEQFTDDGPHRLLVAVDAPAGADTGRVVGWASSTPLRPKPAYHRTVETTVYVAPTHLGLGVGAALYRELLPGLADLGLHRAYAVIAQPNPASHALHAAFGYRPVGTFTEVGHKFGRYIDLTWYEKALG